MPELPEVETIVRELQPVITHKIVKEISISWPRTVEDSHCEFCDAMKGHAITAVTRRGKYICLHLDSGDIVTVHLRMTGKLLFQLPQKDEAHLRVTFGFADGTELYFVDTRKFGQIKRWPKGKPFLPQLGPEPLDSKNVAAVLNKTQSRRAIKTLLLDQHVLAGIGNIYADEALFLSKIHPATPACNVSKPKRRLLAQNIPEILKAAIQNRGTTISDYRKTDSSSGQNQFYLNVYGREKGECRTCKTTIKRIVLNNRSSYFCPRCQRAVAHRLSV